MDFEYTLEIGHRELKVQVEAEAHVYEENYGADADGRRGEMRTFVDDLELTVRDCRGNDLSDKLQAKYPSAWQSLDEIACDKLLEAYWEEL